MLIPDTQVKPGVPLDHLEWAGRYMVDKKPDTVVMIGDFADMPSLSSYDVGKKQFEGRRYKDDVNATHEGMRRLLSPLWRYNSWAKKNHEKRYKPNLVLTYGNHEDRINRAVDSDPKLEGILSLSDLKYEFFGWKTVPFLEPIVIDGVAYCHYFPSGQLGRPVVSARSLLSKFHMSAVAGHQQGRDIAYGKRADGRNITALIAGSFYLHDEDYLSPFTNQHWRGIYMFHEVQDGSFDEMAVSIRYLKRKYGGKPFNPSEAYEQLVGEKGEE
jgi:hypothetical protein